MSFITVPNTFVNGTLTDAPKVNNNFTAIINGVSDGTKDIAVNKVTTSSDVAIGTTDAATARIDVNGASTLLRLNSTSASVEPSMLFTKLSTIHGKIDTYGSSLYLYAGAASGDFRFINNSTGGTEVLTILKGGNVGIGGVTDPQSTLEVGGKILCTDIAPSLFNGSSTDISGTELEILTSGSLSNADSLHTHQYDNNRYLHAFKAQSSLHSGMISTATEYDQIYTGDHFTVNNASGIFTVQTSGTYKTILNISTTQTVPYAAGESTMYFSIHPEPATNPGTGLLTHGSGNIPCLTRTTLFDASGLGAYGRIVETSFTSVNIFPSGTTLYVYHNVNIGTAEFNRLAITLDIEKLA